MKTLLYSITILFILLKCNFRTNVESATQATESSTFKEEFDTIITSKIIPSEISGPNSVMREFYVSYGNNTSAFSCLIAENVINKKISISYNYKTTFVNLKDSATIAVSDSMRKRWLIPTYNQQMGEIKIILAEASKEFDLSKLNTLRLGMLSIEGLSNKLMEEYIKKFREKFKSNSNLKVADLIKNSQFTSDLNTILSPYSLLINKVYVDGLTYYKPIKAFKNVPDTTQKFVLDGIIIFRIGSLNSQNM